MTPDKGHRGGTGARCHKAISSADLVGKMLFPGVWGQKCHPSILGCIAKLTSPTDGCPGYTSGLILAISKMLRRGWEFSLSLIEKAGLRKPKHFLFYFFFRQVSISKKLSSEEICQPSDGISGGDQEEMAKLGVSGSAVMGQGTHLECGKSRFRPGDLNVRLYRMP